MKAFHDPKCKCFKIEKKIKKEFPRCNWNLDDACEAWASRKSVLKNNDIEFESGSDECYACNCPTCGRMICWWCV